MEGRYLGRWGWIGWLIGWFDIVCFDGFFIFNYIIYLGCLAFTLAGKKVKFIEEPAYMNPSMYKGRQIVVTLYMNTFMYKDIDDSWDFVHEPFHVQR